MRKYMVVSKGSYGSLELEFCDSLAEANKRATDTSTEFDAWARNSKYYALTVYVCEVVSSIRQGCEPRGNSNG